MIDIIQHERVHGVQQVLNKGMLKIIVSTCECGEKEDMWPFLLLENSGAVLLESESLILIE